MIHGLSQARKETAVVLRRGQPNPLLEEPLYINRHQLFMLHKAHWFYSKTVVELACLSRMSAEGFVKHLGLLNRHGLINFFDEDGIPIQKLSNNELLLNIIQGRRLTMEITELGARIYELLNHYNIFRNNNTKSFFLVSLSEMDILAHLLVATEEKWYRDDRGLWLRRRDKDMRHEHISFQLRVLNISGAVQLSDVPGGTVSLTLFGEELCNSVLPFYRAFSDAIEFYKAKAGKSQQGVELWGH